jgi:3-isopropylmalate/(R)-2-methylmalate dehydratase large subunit
VIGSCTNGRYSDFKVAYDILKGNKVKPNCRLILIPGSPLVLKELADNNMLQAFIEAGAVIGPSTCGPCIGGHMGILANGEVGLYTTNRNFAGRNGAKNSKVYLCSPAIAAISAINGCISSIN